jgi:hypothetical protein
MLLKTPKNAAHFFASKLELEQASKVGASPVQGVCYCSCGIVGRLSDIGWIYCVSGGFDCLVNKDSNACTKDSREE